MPYKSCAVVARAQKASPKSLVNDDFKAYEGNVPATLFLDLAVAISVYFALFPRRLVGDNTAGSHRVPIRGSPGTVFATLGGQI